VLLNVLVFESSINGNWTLGMVGEYRGQGLFVETKQTLFYRWRALRLVCLVKSIVCCFFVFLWTLVY